MEVLKIKDEPCSDEEQDVLLNVELVVNEEEIFTLPSTKGEVDSSEERSLHTISWLHVTEDNEEKNYDLPPQKTGDIFIREETGQSDALQHQEFISKFSDNDNDLNSLKDKITDVKKEKEFLENESELHDTSGMNTDMKNCGGNQILGCHDLTQQDSHTIINQLQRPDTGDMCGKITSRGNILKQFEIPHSGDKPYSCGVCGKKFKVNRNLKTHERMHVGEQPYCCVVCGKEFVSKGHLKKHEKIHSMEKPYSCAVCGKEFRINYKLKVHQRIHTGEKPYSCIICGKEFGRSCNLKIHQRIHTGEKPYSCVVCGKDFGTNSEVKKHERIHTGEKPYSCVVCSKKFGRSDDLKTHQRVHTGEKPYCCGICGKEFGSNSNLKIHQKLHSGTKPYSCVVCGKDFVSKSYLKKHEIVHTVEKPYSCVVCGKKFQRSNNLKDHGRIHTGEKPYSCVMCGKEFVSNSSLRKHEKTHSRENLELLNNKMSKKRTYTDAFLRYGFVNLPSGGEDRPQCVVCHKVLTNESLKPSKLSAHLQKCHPNLQNDDQAYFQRRAVALKNIQFGSSGIQAQKLQAAVEASYFVAYKVAEQQKCHTTAQNLIMPCAYEMVRKVCGEDQAKRLSYLYQTQSESMTWHQIFCPKLQERSRKAHIANSPCNLMSRVT